jgi:mRNA interferase MazF
MTYSRGDVVSVRFPYAELEGWGRRPALVIQADSIRTELGHTILAQITTTPRTGPTRLAVAADSPVAQQMGLRWDSVILLDVLQATHADNFEKKIGTCPLMDEVSRILTVLLGI